MPISNGCETDFFDKLPTAIAQYDYLMICGIIQAIKHLWSDPNA